MALASMIEDRGARGPHNTRQDEDFIVSSTVPFPGAENGWARVIGGSGAEGAKSILEIREGGYLLCGYTFSHGTGDADILTVKTGSSGNLLWAKTYGGMGTEYGYNCTEIQGGYLIIGYTTSFGAGSKDMYVLKIDKEGTEIWSKTYGGKSWDAGMSACESDGGYMICGFTHSYGRGEEDIYLVHTDIDGNELWSKTYGGERYEIGNTISGTIDGNFIIGATTGTFGNGNSDMYLVKIDPSGNELWTKSIGGQMNSILPEASRTPHDWCQQMITVSDGGIALVGYTNARDIMNALVVKTDDNGNILWGQNLGNSPFYDYGYSLAEGQDGELYICGAAKSTRQDNDILLACIERDGKITSVKTLGTVYGSDWGNAIHVSAGGEIIIAGHTNSYGSGSLDMCLLKLNYNALCY
jgi:hypothetical protein